MPGFLIMANINVTLDSFDDFYLKSYPINDEYIYFLVFEYSDQKYHYSNNRLVWSDFILMSDIGYDSNELPYWSYGTNPSGIDASRLEAYLEVFEDNLIFVSTSSLFEQIQLSLKSKSGNQFLDLSVVSSTPPGKGGDDQLGSFTFMCCVDTDSGNVTHVCNPTDSRRNNDRNMAFPVHNVSKGIFMPTVSSKFIGGSSSTQDQTLRPLSERGNLSEFQGNFNTLVGVSSKIKRKDKDDPHNGGGDSQGGGGGGNGNIGGVTNSDDGLPTIQATDSGLMTLYNPTTSELQSLGKFLWSDAWSLDNFKKLFNDPFDTLLGLSVVPIKPNTTGSRNIMFGNLDSGVTSAVVASQWVSKSMGSITFNEVWKGALDYAPSTGVSIYLPFIGMRQLNVNDVMGSTIELIYKFDVLTGTCIAQLYVNHDAQGNKDDGFSWNHNQGLLYEFQGQCGVNIPLSSQDYTNTIRAAISAVGMIAGVGASVATGNPAIGMASLAVGMANTGIQAGTPTVERSGHMSGSASILGYTKPFLIVERPHQCKPSYYYKLRGIPSQVYTSKLSDCTGFTQITDNNNIKCAGAEDSELQEIEQLLSSGVYFPSKKR